MSRRNITLLVFLGLIMAGLLATPTILRAVPPRYLARLPKPIQDIGAPPQTVAVLPTAAATANVALLLNTATAVPLPPTNTPMPITNQSATATPPASPTLPPTYTPPPPTPTQVPIPAAARLEGITHQFQEWNNCGPATLAMTLSYFGVRTNQKETAVILKPSPEDRNVSPAEMVAYVNNHTDLQALTRANGDPYTIRRLIANGFPVILEIGIDPPGEFRWMGWYGHYMLVVAYDDARQQFWTYDSWLGTSDEPLKNADADGRDLSYTDLAAYWPHFNRSYIVLYEPARAAEVADIIGPNMDDATMWQNALQTVRAETAAAPENAFNWFNLGTIYNALGQYEEASAAYDQARAIGLPWRMLWYQFGPYEAYYQSGRYEDVIVLADVTLENRPYFEESFYYRGLAEEALGNLDTAQQDLLQAAAFNPNFTPAASALSEIQNGGS
ncbi:MAG: C39 family peptidase [Chloroflexi bacterium]|nr:C39 family peptidase [Chloroflexota bacterium]